MKYKYIKFVKIEDKEKTSVWSCRNIKGENELGIIKWYPAWHQYCYFPTVQAVSSADCLFDIGQFINSIRSKLIEKDVK